MPKIYLYAEVLTHIRQLTLHASLQSEKDESPEIDISSDKKVITVKHDGESSSLYLPTQILGTANVTFETGKKTELNARVQIEDVEEWKNIEAAGIEAPWIASELTPDTAIQCRICKEQILPAQRVSTWKDLPSQDWADVMDLWYCHKPHEGNDSTEQKDAAAAKGTSATSKLASQQGTGMVDLTSFVLHPDDCMSTKISAIDNENDLKPRDVECSKCSTLLGSFSSSENLIRLDKSSLGVKRTAEESYISYDPSLFIGAQMLSLIETTPVRKIVVYSKTPSEPQPQSDSANDGPHPTEAADSQSIKPKTSREQQQEAEAELLAQPSPAEKHEQESKDQKQSSPSEGQEQEQEHQDQNKPTQTHEESDSQSSPSSSSPPQPQPQISTSTEPPSPSPEPSPEQPGLLLWIFNPNIYYSSSLHPSNASPQSIATAHRALKIFYTTLPSPSTPLSPSQYLSLHNSTVEDLPLPTPSHLKSLHRTLQESTSLLPPQARKFQTWDVGLLDRYERHATAEEVLGENPLSRKGEEGEGGMKSFNGEVKLPEGWEELYL